MIMGLAVCRWFGASRSMHGGLRRLKVAGSVTAALFLMSTAPYMGAANAQETAPLTKAIELFSEGDYTAAITILEKVIAGDPALAEAHYFLGLSKAGQNDHPAALDAFSTAAEIDPAQPGLALNTGISHFTLGNYQPASDAFTDAIIQDPQDASAHLFDGLTAFELGEPERAVVALEEARRLDPSLAQLALYNIGVAEAQLGRDAQSQQALEAAIAEDPATDIAESARALLAGLQPPQDDPKRFSASFSAGIELDDNVTTDEVDLVSAEADWAYVIDFNADYTVLRGTETTIDVGYSFFQSLYDEQTAFNLQSHNLSATVDHSIGDWDLGGTVYYARTFLNDNDFLGIASVIPTLGTLVNDSLYVSFNYTFDAKNFTQDDNRDAIKNGAGVGVVYFFWNGAAMASASYDLGTENARSEEFDLIEHKLNLGFRTDIPVPDGVLKDANPRFKLGYKYTWKDYTGVTAAIGKERKDERDTITAGLSADLGDYAFATADYERIVARSNLQTADFNEDIFTFRVGVRY